MTEATWTITYSDRNSNEVKMAIVRVDYRDAKFTATNLDLWGCGKAAFIPKWAIMNLLQDRATLISATPQNWFQPK